MTEPSRLLEAFQPHLTELGGVREQSIPNLLNLMTSCNRKLVPKCISLCIISSSPPEVQLKLCKDGAWDILLKWLQEALKEDNFAFLLELLNVYLILPVRFEQLTQNVCPKLINSLTKRCEHEAVKSVASEIVKKWKEVISNDSRRLDQPVVKRKKSDPEMKQEPVDQKFESLKDEKKRRRTVKVPPTVMRTAGMEESSVISQPKSRSDVLSKKIKSETENRLNVEVPIESFHQKITVTPTEPRKVSVEMHESSDFINALTTTPHPIIRKKRKIPMKFELPLQIDSPTIKTDSSMDTSDVTCPDDTSPSPSPQGMGQRKSSLTSIASSFSVDIKPKKRVSWADEDKLQSFYYFELDESERVNVNRVSVEEIRRKELSMERQPFKLLHDDHSIGLQKWSTPKPLERIFLVDPGCKSVERQIQAERERYVLQAIYFTRESIPPSPQEPDPETVELRSPLNIPLDDILTIVKNDEISKIRRRVLASDQSILSKVLTAFETCDNSNVSTEKLLVLEHSMGNSQMSLNPEVANLVKSLAANLTNSPNQSSLNLPVHISTTSPPIVSDSPAVLSNPVPEYQATRPELIAEHRNDHYSPNPDPITDKALQNELWEVLEKNYPDMNVRELSAERIRDLLEPLRDQLYARGIFSLRGPTSNNLPPPLQCVRPDPDDVPPMHQPYPILPPPPMLPPCTRPDFRPHPPRHCPPMSGGFRGGPRNGHRPPMPPFAPPGPLPPPCRPMPMCNGMPPPTHRGGGGGHFARGNPRSRPPQLCKFFQQGLCRHGSSCVFMH